MILFGERRTELMNFVISRKMLFGERRTELMNAVVSRKMLVGERRTERIMVLFLLPVLFDMPFHDQRATGAAIRVARFR